MTALDERLAAITRRGGGRLRSLESVASPQGREIRIGERSLLNFCSNDYLGLSTHPAVVAAAREALRTHGVGSGAAALLSGRSELHDELERRLAACLGCESALLYSSGYLANLGVIGALVRRHDHVFQDRLNHASLIDAVALTRAPSTRFPHLDAAALATALAANDAPARWIVTDTLFSMDGDVAPLDEYARIARANDAILIGDDAHGFGVLGGGLGAGAEFSLSATDLPIRIITFGKALGTAGAAVVGSAALVQALVQASRTFIYDTAPPPAIAAATIAALEVILDDRARHERLRANIGAFRNLARDLPLMPSSTPIQPVMISDDDGALAIAAALNAAGIYARAIRPPTVPAGTARIRVCLTAAHEPADIGFLVDTLREAIRAQAP